jgi:hypothetical protein
MAFACPFCNQYLSTRSAYSQHVKRCSENYDSSSSSSSSSSEEIFIQNESDIIMPEQEVININEMLKICYIILLIFLIILYLYRIIAKIIEIMK